MLMTMIIISLTWAQFFFKPMSTNVYFIDIPAVAAADATKAFVKYSYYGSCLERFSRVLSRET